MGNMFLFNDLSRYTSVNFEVFLGKAREVIESAWFVGGSNVAAFEEEFAQYCGVSKCVSVGNGTDALEIAIKALELETHSLIALVSNAGMYASSAIDSTHHERLYMDVDEESMLVTLAEVEKAVAMGADAIIVTHLFGRGVPEIVEIAAFCKASNVWLIEDCSQAHGSRINGRHVGTFGDFGTFSFYPTKNLGALGDGGALVTNSEKLARAAKQLKQYGWGRKYFVEVAGGVNTRLDEIQAAFLRAALIDLEARNAKRISFGRKYSQNIVNNDIRLPEIQDDGSHVAHLYVIQSEHRNSLAKHLEGLRLPYEIHFPVADHLQMRTNSKMTGDLEVSRNLAGRVLSLPCYPELEESEFIQIVDAVNQWRM